MKNLHNFLDKKISELKNLLNSNKKIDYSVFEFEYKKNKISIYLN